MGVDPVSLAINAALTAAQMAVTASQTIEGPRLADTRVTTAAYGTPMNYLIGTRRLDGMSCIWAEPLREVKQQRKTKGGKYNDYTYFATFAILVADQPDVEILKLLFDRNLVFDVTGAGPVSAFPSGDITQYMRIMSGGEDQLPDPRMQATIEAEFGPGFCPAYRGCTLVVFEELPVEKLGNRLPQVSGIGASASETRFPYETFDTQPMDSVPWTLGGFAYSPDRTRAVWGGYDAKYEIWDIAARRKMIGGELAGGGTGGFAPTSRHGLFGLADNYPTHDLVRWADDGTGPMQTIVTLAQAVSRLQAIEAPDGAALICFGGQSTFSGLYKLQAYNLNLGVLSVEDTGVWMPSHFCLDAYGDIWAVLHKSPLSLIAQTEIMVRRVWDSGARPGSLGEAIIGGLTPSFVFSDGIAAIMHGAGGLMVSWARVELILIDLDTLTIAATRALDHSVFRFAQLASAAPGAASVWMDPGALAVTTAFRISTSDLSTLQTADFTDYFTTANQPVFYDPINNALIGANTVTNDKVTWFYLDRAAGSGVELRDLIERVAEACGLEPGDFDASDCDQPLAGYSWTQGQGDQILGPALEVYDAEARPHDFGLEFRKRGAASIGTIPRGDFVGGYSAPLAGDGGLPLALSLTFADPDLDQQPNTVRAQRPAATADTRREVSIDASTLVFDVDEARQVAEGLLRRRWFEASTVELALRRDYSRLEPGDSFVLALDDVERGAKVTRMEFAGDGRLNMSWARSAPAIHALSGLAGAPADGIIPGVITVVGYTRGLALDIPLIRDADEGLILYLAGGPYSDDLPWPGATFYRSDDGVAFEDTLGEIGSTQRAVIGSATDVLPAAGTTVWDRASTVTVSVFAGALSSATEAEVLNGANRALVGDEVIGFATAALVADGVYELSTLLRGRRGTEWATAGHAIGDRFILLAGLPDVTLGASDFNDTLYVRPVTTGGASGFTQTLTFEGRSLKPYAPCHLWSEDVAGDLVLSWTRRTRLGGDNVYGATPPLGETSEEYVVRIYDAADALLRTYSGLSSPTVPYSAADRASDGGAGDWWDARQVSSVVGPGDAASAEF